MQLNGRSSGGEGGGRIYCRATGQYKCEQSCRDSGLATGRTFWIDGYRHPSNLWSTGKSNATNVFDSGRAVFCPRAGELSWECPQKARGSNFDSSIWGATGSRSPVRVRPFYKLPSEKKKNPAGQNGESRPLWAVWVGAVLPNIHMSHPSERRDGGSYRVFSFLLRNKKIESDGRKALFPMCLLRSCLRCRSDGELPSQ